MWLLFEAGIFFSRFFLKRKDEYSKGADERYNSNDGNSGTAAAGAAATGAAAATFADDEALADSEMEAEMKKLDRESEDLDDSDAEPGP